MPRVYGNSPGAPGSGTGPSYKGSMGTPLIVVKGRSTVFMPVTLQVYLKPTARLCDLTRGARSLRRRRVYVSIAHRPAGAVVHGMIRNGALIHAEIYNLSRIRYPRGSRCRTARRRYRTPRTSLRNLSPASRREKYQPGPRHPSQLAAAARCAYARAEGQRLPGDGPRC